MRGSSVFKQKEKVTLEFTEDQIRHSMNEEMLAGPKMNIGTEDGGSELEES